MAARRGKKSTDAIFDDPLWSDWLFWVANSFALLGGIDTARSWSGPIIGVYDTTAFGVQVAAYVVSAWLIVGVLPGWIRRAYRRRRARQLAGARPLQRVASSPTGAAREEMLPATAEGPGPRTTSEADFLIEASTLRLELDDGRLLAMGYELRDAAEIGDLASLLASFDDEDAADELRGLARVAVRTLPPSWKR